MLSTPRRRLTVVASVGLIGACSLMVPLAVHGQAAIVPVAPSESKPKATNLDFNQAAVTEPPPAAVNPEVAAESEKERIAAERFLAVLEKNPRRGTALDKVYAFHIDRGTLKAWVQQYRDRAQQQPQDGIAWTLLGLIELQRGEDSGAVQAFQKAEQFLPENALASYYYGQSLMLVEQSDAAAAAFERALTRNPAPTDQLEIFQTLGRLYQRTRQTEKALAVWGRLEQLFPNDLRVQEQIAQTLVEEGQPELALPRYAALATQSTKDLYRQSQFRIRVAELKIQLNKTPEALSDFEKLLGELNPDNWLYRDVRQKIEAIYLRNEDQAGLVTYYQGWLDKHPDDVDALARLARVLYGQGRTPESRVWLERGLKLAPTRQELRKAIIDQLLVDQKYAEAIPHYEVLNQQTPGNPDTIREWGRVILKDTTRPLAARQQAAIGLWQQLLVAKPKDPVVVTQVADLLRQSGLTEEALKLYRQAVELAPEAPQYREYLGEYYHQLKQPAEALATWQEIVAGKNRNAANLSRLGEVLSGFGYLAEGTKAFQEAIALDPQDFGLRLKLAKVLQRGKHYDQSLEQLTAAEKLVTNAEEFEIILQQKLLNYESAQTLAGQIESLTEELRTAPLGSQPGDKTAAALAQKWYVLARYCEAARKGTESLFAVQKAMELDPQSIPILSASARIQEANHNLVGAVETNRRLATIDRRFRSEHLTKVAKLEGQLGRVDTALKAGREVLAAASSNPESYQFYAQLCFELGAHEEGLETLRRAVRMYPSDLKVLLALAEHLAEQFKTPEAIEFYWRAFDKGTDIDAKLNVITKLAELYFGTNHFDQLLARLERQRRSAPQDMRVATLCLAQAQQAVGDNTAARGELERLLTADTRDTALLQQLARLAAKGGDFTAAVNYQRQLVQIVPGKETTVNLANYLSQAGETEEAGALLTQMTLEIKDPVSLLQTVNSLLSQGHYARVVQVTSKIREQEPSNWEYLYYEGVALSFENPAAAEQRFRQLLEITAPEHELGLIQRTQQASTANIQPNQQIIAGLRMPFFGRQRTLQRIRTTVASSPKYLAIRSPGRGLTLVAIVYSPDTFTDARMAALGLMLKVTEQQGKQTDFVQSIRLNWEQNKTSERAVWDWYTVHFLQQRQSQPFIGEQSLDIIRELIDQPHPSLEAQVAYLNILSSRNSQTNFRIVGTELRAAQMLRIYLDVKKDPEFQPIHDSYYGVNLLYSVVRELRLAKLDRQADQLFSDTLKGTTSLNFLLKLMQVNQLNDRMEMALQIWNRADEIQVAMPAETRLPPSIFAEFLVGMMMRYGQAGRLSDIAAVTDRYLTATQHRQRAMAAAGRPPMPVSTITASSMIHLIGRGSRYPRQIVYSIFMSSRNGRLEQMTLTFPTPNAYYDCESILVLRNAFAQYQRLNQVSKLIGHFEIRAKATDVPPEDRLPWQLGLVYLHTWAENKGAAVIQMKNLCEQFPEELRLQLAETHHYHSNWAEALEQLDAIKTLDPDLLEKRESLALLAARRVDNVERAKSAAMYLMARLTDAESQLELVLDLKSLGLNEQADVLLGRASRHPSSRLDTLVGLMAEFKNKAQPDAAADIAVSILRRTSGAAPTGNTRRLPSTGKTIDTQQARTLAIEYLQSTGRLEKLTTDLESQLRSQPKSLLLNQTLIEYYKAAGNQKRADEVAFQLAKWNIGDPTARWNIGMQYLANGSDEQGIAILTAVIKQNPSLLQRRLPDLDDLLRSPARKLLLAKMLDGVDLHLVGNSAVITDLASSLTSIPETYDAGLALFKRAWITYPENRPQMLSLIRSKQAWKTPEFLELARQTIIPQSGVPNTDPWGGFQISLHRGEGKISGLLNDVLLAGYEFDKLAEMEQEVSQAIKDVPKWSAGPALLGIIQIQRGNHAAGIQTLKTFNEQPESLIPSPAAWLIAQELSAIPDGEALAIQYYERSAAHPPWGHPNRQSYESFVTSPECCLVNLHLKHGQKEQARQILLKLVPPAPDEGENVATETKERVHVQNDFAIAERLVQMGASLDALRLYHRLRQRTSTPAPQLAVIGRSRWLPAEQLSTYQKIIEAIGAEEFITEIDTILKTPATDGVIAPTIDLLLVSGVPSVNPPGSEYHHLQLRSLLSSLLEKFSKEQKSRDAVTAALQRFRQARPDDVTILITSCMFAFYDPDTEAFLKSVEQLDRWVAAHPPEPQKEGGEGQPVRKVGEIQRALWLVGRECQLREDLRPFGERLYRRASDAARLNQDFELQSAICYEAGLIAADAGDTATGAARWTDELESILSRPSPVTLTVFAKATPATNTPPIHPITVDELRSIQFLSFRAVSREMLDLSHKAIRFALRSGPPIPHNFSRRGNAVTIQLATDDSEQKNNSEVFSCVQNSVARWNRLPGPAEETYHTLFAVVFPEARPTRVYLYPKPFSQAGEQPLESLGLLLVKQAILANKVEHLREKLQTQLALPESEFPARLLLAMLAMETRDIPGAQTALRELCQRIDMFQAENTTELLCLVVLPAQDHNELILAVEPLLERVLKFIDATGTPAMYRQRGDILARLAQQHYKAGQLSDGKRLLEKYQESQEIRYEQYDNDYNSFVRKRALYRVAHEFALAGQLDDALDKLGKSADLPEYNQFQEPSPARDGLAVYQLLVSISPEERYRLLSLWTLVVAGRNTIRVMDNLGPNDASPPVWMEKIMKLAGVHHVRRSQILQQVAPLAIIHRARSAKLLVQTAVEAGKLDELEAEVRQLATQKVERARELLLLIRLAQPVPVLAP
ncbi:MAG: tetratricopeptide repeat protein [Planctomycetota bacterium]